jgi:hypothetical protein
MAAVYAERGAMLRSVLQSYHRGTARYPVIYATEGDAPYGTASGGAGSPVTAVSRFDVFRQIMQRRGTQAILVGIGGTDRRNTDFLLPTALAYRDFIEKELVPRIESTPVTLLLGAGAADGTTRNATVRTIYARLASRNYAGLALVKSEFATTHVGADAPAFEDALQRYFP